MREWLSGGAPPCQGGGRGFDPRLALFLFSSGSLVTQGLPLFVCGESYKKLSPSVYYFVSDFGKVVKFNFPIVLSCFTAKSCKAINRSEGLFPCSINIAL